jgi:hypothetical protein
MMMMVANTSDVTIGRLPLRRLLWLMVVPCLISSGGRHQHQQQQQQPPPVGIGADAFTFTTSTSSNAYHRYSSTRSTIPSLSSSPSSSSVSPSLSLFSSQLFHPKSLLYSTKSGFDNRGNTQRQHQRGGTSDQRAFGRVQPLWMAARRDSQNDEDDDDVGVDNDNNASSTAPSKTKSSSSSSSSRVVSVDELIQDVSLRMRRASWLSWWVQLILTTISAVTLLFTRNVTDMQVGGGAGSSSMMMLRPILPNYALVGSGIVLSFGSIFWTWATRRLSRRLLRKPTTRIQAANMLRKDITVGTVLNLLGIAVLVVGMQQVIGGLAIKVLTTATTAAPAIYQPGQSLSLLQPLDILVVQANTNALSSHFCGLVAYLYMGRSIGRLDPPSVEGDVRARG